MLVLPESSEDPSAEPVPFCGAADLVLVLAPLCEAVGLTEQAEVAMVRTAAAGKCLKIKGGLLDYEIRWST